MVAFSIFFRGGLKRKEGSPFGPQQVAALGGAAGDFDERAFFWDEAERHLAFVMGRWQLRGMGTWAVELKETGAFVGRRLLRAGRLAGVSSWPGRSRRWWGNGYATEAARAALDHAFTVWTKDRVISLIDAENQASIRVAERLGEWLQRRLRPGDAALRH